MFEKYKAAAAARQKAMGFVAGYAGLESLVYNCDYAEGYIEGQCEAAKTGEGWQVRDKQSEEIVMLRDNLANYKQDLAKAKEDLVFIRKVAKATEDKLQEVLAAVRAIPHSNRRKKHA